MHRHALSVGLEDAVIINTCSVTAEAERQARQSIRRMRRERPHAKIIVTGCAVNIDPQKFRSMPEVDAIIANERKTDLESFKNLPSAHQEIKVPPRHSRRNGELQRAFIEVQNGCDHDCTFCIIPAGRGASRSVPMGLIAERVREAAGCGYQEIVFTGVDITSYGHDLPLRPSLGEMVRRVLRSVPTLKRLRLSSLDPAALDEDLWDLIAEEPRLMPHLHLSLQAGDDMVLKRMKRRHSRDDIVRLCERARKIRPDVTFGADIIAGFPTETETMFENTYALVEQCAITWLHVFPYSARAGTPAARMPQVNGAVRKQRAERLRTLGEKMAQEHMRALIGQTVELLIEQEGLGCSPQFAKIVLDDPAPLGELVKMECYQAQDGVRARRL